MGLGKVEDSSQSVVKDTYYVVCGKSDKALKTTWARMGSFRQNQPPSLMEARFDRQLYSGIGIEVSKKGFDLIGKERTDYLSAAMEKERGYRTPSDHFGLVVDYFINV